MSKNRKPIINDDIRNAFSALHLPLMMAAGPLTGYFIGLGLDKFFHTSFLKWVFLIAILYPTFIIIKRIIKEVSGE